MPRFDYSSSIMLDKVATQLRSAMVDLQVVLEMIERTDQVNKEYMRSTLRAVEDEIRHLRKSIEI